MSTTSTRGAIGARVTAVGESRPGSLTARLAATTRVLVVEDDPDIADFLRAYFRASGYDVVHVDPTSCDEGLAAVREHRPDCVLLDLWLRGFSGLQLYRRIRTHDELDCLPVIVLTADIAAKDRTEPMATGIDGFVPKPFGADELAELVSSRIAAAKALAERGVVDPVSGALSAAALDGRIAAEVEMASTTGEPLTFALVALRAAKELDGPVADWVVRRLVDALRPALPVGSVVGRTGGGELAVLVPGVAAAGAAEVLDQALRPVRGAHELPGGGEVRPDPVAGVASWPAHAVDGEGLFMAADAALAEALGGAGAVAVAR